MSKIGCPITLGEYNKIKESESNNLEVASLETIKKMITEDSEIITLLYGENSSDELIQSLVDQLEELYPEIEVETHEGGQPVYPLLISVE